MIPQNFLQTVTPASRTEKIIKDLPSRPEEFYIFYIGRKPAGMLVLGTSHDADPGPDTGEIFALYLLPEHWGKGCGKERMGFRRRPSARYGETPESDPVCSGS